MEEIRIKELGDIYTGKTPPTANPINFGNIYPFVTPVDLADNKFINLTERYVSKIGIKHTTLIPSNSICVSCIGYIGKIGITKTDSCTNQQINSIVVNDNYDVDYVYYLLSYNVPYFKELAGVNVVPQLNKSDFSKVKLVASKFRPEQTAIATILSKVDEAIEATKQSIKAAEKLKKSLMQNLLTGKLKPDGTWRKDDEFYEDEKFGKVPVAWEIIRFGKLFDILSGKGFSFDEYVDKGVKLIKIDNVGWSKVLWNNTTFLPTEYIEMYPKLLLAENDIIVALNRPITQNKLKIAILTKDDEPSLLYQRVGKFILDEDKVNKKFSYYFLTIFLYKFIRKMSVGSDQPFINVSTLRKQSIFIPSDTTEQDGIGNKLYKVDLLLKSKQTKIRTLQRLKKSLMQNLLTGKIRLNVEQINKTIGKQTNG